MVEVHTYDIWFVSQTPQGKILRLNNFSSCLALRKCVDALFRNTDSVGAVVNGGHVVQNDLSF